VEGELQSKYYVYLGYLTLGGAPNRHVYTVVSRECAFLRGQRAEHRSPRQLLEDHTLALEYPLCDAEPGDIVYGKPATPRAIKQGKRSGWAKPITQIRPLSLYNALRNPDLAATDSHTETLERLKLLFLEVDPTMHAEFFLELFNDLMKAYKNRTKPQ